ncbi:MAG: hypothetical protein Q9162_002441 [Coniocarpon cinnabarinum]
MQAHDYSRASRIFGMLLRFEPPGLAVAGAHVDLRKQNLWGIGAEILLQRVRDPISDTRRGQTSHISDAGDLRSFPDSLSTEQGFEDAKSFYQRLVLQYPYRKTSRSNNSRSDEFMSDSNGGGLQSTVSALDFYPILFNLWIFQVQARTQERKANVEELHRIYQYSQQDITNDVDEACNANANEILSIVEQMNEVTRAPPYDRHTELLQMQGDVRMWLADVLSESSQRSHEIAKWRQEAQKLYATVSRS